MAYRNISQYFWTDSKVADFFTPEDKYFMLYLLTNPHVTLLGCYEISIKQMSCETGYNRDTIFSLLDRFKTQYEVIDYSEADREILIKNWYKHNWAKSPKVLAALRKHKSDIKCEQFRDYIDKKIIERFNFEVQQDNTDNADIEHRTSNIEHRTSISENIEHRTYHNASIDYPYGIDTISNVQNAQNTPSKLYGMYKNVILTDEEYNSFKGIYPSSYETKINRLSFYITQSGKTYHNHYAVLTEWAKEDETKAKESKSESSFDTDSFYEAALAKSYGG